jgi:hypothetical protein
MNKFAASGWQNIYNVYYPAYKHEKAEIKAATPQKITLPEKWATKSTINADNTVIMPIV